MSIKLENVVLASPKQMEFIIEGMRNPMNSWEKSDSFCIDSCTECTDRLRCAREMSPLGGPSFRGGEYIGPNDYSLMQRLANAGTDHRKFMRMMPVYVRITAPLYWWAEADTYKIGTVRNSCSFMHKGMSKEFSINDFSLKDEQIYYILNPLTKKSYKLEYPYETNEFRIFTDKNGRTYKVYRNGYVVREAFDYIDSCGKGRKRHFDEAPVTLYQNKEGYFIVKLSGRNGGQMLLHRMVANVWCERPEGTFQVDHKNGNKGDNSAENLEWVTAKENMKRGIEYGLFDELNGLHHSYKLWKNSAILIPPEKRLQFAIDVSKKLTCKELADIYNITPQQANNSRYTMSHSEHEDLFQECYLWEQLIDHLNYLRSMYLETKDEQIFQQIRCLIPQGYLQTSNVMLNYEVLANIYKSRNNHKLDEWRVFCKWIEELPYSELICGNIGER